MRLDLIPLDRLDEVQLASLALKATTELRSRLDSSASELPTFTRREYRPATDSAILSLEILHHALARVRPPAAAQLHVAGRREAADALFQELG